LASVTHLPFREHVFDLSFMVTVLLHVKPNKRKAAIFEASRVAKDFYNFDSIQGKPRISWFTKIFLKLNRQGLKYTQLTALVSLLISFPIERTQALRHNMKHETTYILEKE
jgi:ubiquinone/menaquinone biosynthesis C-methylase UbiE